MGRLTLMVSLLVAAALTACSDDDGSATTPNGGDIASDTTPEGRAAGDTEVVLAHDGTGAAPENASEERAFESQLDREYPLHGLVTGLQIPVRRGPDAEADTVGWLRIGNRIRLERESTPSANCASGWYGIHPQGFACAGQGIEVGEAPPESELAVAPPARDTPLPYAYWFVKDELTPEFHALPSRDAQRAADVLAARVLELRRANQEERAARVLAGEAPGEPEKPPAVNRLLDRGFFVAGVGGETRSDRQFVRTVRGRFARQSQLIERTGSEFVGVELGPERSLPLAWVVRGVELRVRRDRADGTVAFVRDLDAPPLERHTLVTGWLRRENIGGQVMHVLEGERYVRDWFLAVAEPIEKPREVAEDEPWVHVDLSQQTLVLYLGDTPTYATLVSSGQGGFTTKTGLFTIRRKYVADTMANIGDGNDARYSIEDVPWTQYFEGSLALHGAFWHDQFGLVRSHGCVNLAPRDAHHVFDALWPRVPDGWLGVTTEHGTFRASHVLVTE